MADTISDKLTRLNEVKQSIKQSIINKGVQVADDTPFRIYADKIGEISGGGGEPSDEWQPNPNWWDIKKILDEDTRDYAGKVGVVLYNFNDVSDFILSSTAMNAVATSDGAFYSYANNGAQVSHNWDTSKDKDDGRGFKTRWVIYYYKTDSTSDTFQQSALKFGWAYNYIAYLVLRINCTSGSSFCGSQRALEAIDNVGYRISGTNFSSFCGNCNSLRKLPDVLDTSNSTLFSNFCSYCYALTKLTDVLDTSKGTSFNSFCYYCYNLRKLPDVLDTSKGTNFSSFCYYCSSLQKLPDVLDTGSGLNFASFCSYCISLQKLPDVLDTSSGTSFSSFCGSCHSLTKLPDVLDTSKGTSFNSFCGSCYALKKLPDVLDTGKGANFNSFCGNCASLQHTPEITMVSNTTSITSKSNGAFPNVAWLETVLLTLPSNTNVWLDMSTRISIESFRYVADHAPDVTATPRKLTVGSTNISRINAEDPTIITDLQAKGWTIA